MNIKLTGVTAETISRLSKNKESAKLNLDIATENERLHAQSLNDATMVILDLNGVDISKVESLKIESDSSISVTLKDAEQVKDAE